MKLIDKPYIVLDGSELEVDIDSVMDDRIGLEIPVHAIVDGVDCLACGQKSYWKWGD